MTSELPMTSHKLGRVTREIRNHLHTLSTSLTSSQRPPSDGNLIDVRSMANSLQPYLPPPTKLVIALHISVESSHTAPSWGFSFSPNNTLEVMVGMKRFWVYCFSGEVGFLSGWKYWKSSSQAKDAARRVYLKGSFLAASQKKSRFLF